MDRNEHFVADWQSAAPENPAPDRESIHIWRIAIDESPPGDVVASRRAILSNDETTRAGRFHFEKHRNQYILCRGALRMLLGRYLGRPPETIKFEYEQHGKPVLSGDGNAPDSTGLAFNVSHSGDYALAAITRGDRIGIDIERIRALPDADRLVERFFSEAEGAAYRGLSRDFRDTAFFSCWTRKEAFIKALGEGLSRPLHSFDVSLRPGEPARLLRIEGCPGEESRWALSSFEPAPGYTAAVISEKDKIGDILFYDFDFM